MDENSFLTEIRKLELRVNILEKDVAVRKERDVHIDRRFDTLEKMQKEVQNTLYKVGWLVVGTVISTGLVYIIGGPFGA